ncbi:MAG TPA: ABC transporter permease [Candidatus Sulfotelmatobacter sp.]|nr:ABC transporter permease [Candidatus Sulfotelmatobacter sp.]
MEKQRRTTWLTGFLAILYYEFLWNLRKKKIVGLFILVFAIVTLELALPPLLDYYNGVPLTPNSNVVFDFFNGLSGIFLFLIAVATTMNTISGEFETGSITPLLTKPVSKNTVFLGKIVASFLTLLGIYAFLTVYVTVGGILIEGSQNNLQLIPLGLVGLILATMVWGSLVILLGTLSKSSLVAALGSFGVWIGVTIAGGVLGSVFGQTTILFYAPGSGATGSTSGCGTGRLEAGGAFATGTDNLGYMLMQWALNGSTTLNFCGFRFRGGATETFLASSDTIANVAIRDVGVTLAYLVVFLFLSWYAFRRAQIMESA